MNIRKYLCEFVGTLVLVVFACGAAVAATTSSLGALTATQATLLISVAFGLAIVAMAYSIGNVSGCHINPAVSLGMWLSGRMELKEMLCYWVSQFLGGIAGAWILTLLFKGNQSLGQNTFGDMMAISVGWKGALAVEALLTFVFVLLILCVTSKPENSSVAGLVIGLTLTVVHIIGIPFTGTSVNPARSLGPALLAGGVALEQVWVFFVGPLVGAAVAALFYRFVMTEKKG